MKSPYSNSQGNCVDVTYISTPDGEFVRIVDTKGKTGPYAHLLFDRDEWDAFVKGVKDGVFDWDALTNATSSPEVPETSRRVAGLQTSPIPQRRTKENIAYINGRHDEREGTLVPLFVFYCRRNGLSTHDDRSRRIYDSYLTGRRAEAHDASIREGN